MFLNDKTLTKQEKSWILYDVGNSAYTMLACSLIPIWFKNLAKGELTDERATSIYALGISLVTVIVALLGPICGALADHKDRRKIFFTTSVALGNLFCVINGFSKSWVSFMVVYILTKIFYQASLTFYDSMLNDVTTEDKMDRVSNFGYAWGYIGSCIPFSVALVAYLLGPDMMGKISESLSKIIGFTVTAIWWMLVTLPLIRNYKQIYYVDAKESTIGMAFRKIGGTLKKIVKEDRKVLLFLLAFFLYIDGVNTIIDNCINIGTALGLPTVGQVVFLLATQVVAWLGSLVFTRLSKKYDTVPLLLICIAGYFAVSIYALFLRNLIDFGILAFGVGCFQGSIQALSRSYYSRIIPPENSGEYFGLYDIFSKGASFLGSALIGVVMLIPGGNINIAVASLAVFFGLGFLFLKLADKAK